MSTYKACRDRAYAYLTGEKDFLAETVGQKTRHFYMNILRPEDPQFITLDGHMYSVWVGKRMRMREAAGLGWGSRYDKIALDFRRVARKEGLLPNQLQATLWFTWKRINKILFKHQLDYLQRDVWGLILEAEEIKPFPHKAKV